MHPAWRVHVYSGKDFAVVAGVNESSVEFVSPWRQGGRAVWSCVRKHVLGGVCAIAVQVVAVVVVLLLIVVLVVVMVMVVVLVLYETQSSKFPCYLRAPHFTARA